MKSRLFVLVSLLLISNIQLNAQIISFEYSQQLLDVQDKWHEVVLTPEIVKNCKLDFSDLRIIGVKNINDTLEYPYISKQLEEEKEFSFIESDIINRTTKNGFSFLTIQNSNAASINKIKFETNQIDYNVYLKLEGSNDNINWFRISDSSRIVGVSMDGKKYVYNDIVFEKSNFQYFRVSYKSQNKFKIKSASTYWQNVNNGEFYDIEIASQSRREKDNTSYLEIDFKERVAISQLEVKVDDDIDYFRNVTLSYLADSTLVNGKVNYQYVELKRSQINSWKNNIIDFRTRKMSKIRIAILNNDNQPLRKITVKSKLCKTALTIRTNDVAEYFLTYGNESTRRPNYDIERFKDKIPSSLKRITIDPNVINYSEGVVSPGIQKYWLWLVLLLVVFVIGGATVYMMKNKQ